MGLLPRAGIGNVREGLHPVQERLAMAHGSQVLTPCMLCTCWQCLSTHVVAIQPVGMAFVPIPK